MRVTSFLVALSFFLYGCSSATSNTGESGTSSDSVDFSMLYIENADTSTARLILSRDGTTTELPGAEGGIYGGIQLSKDGNLIVFTRRDVDDEGYSIYAMMPEDSGPTIIAHGPALSGSGRNETYISRISGVFDLAPDGSAITFTSTDSQSISPFSSDTELYVSNFDGSGRVLLLDAEPWASDSISHPIFDPTGQRIAFSWARGPGESSGIYAIDRDGSNLQLLASVPTEAIYPTSISWSPTGKEVVLVSQEGNSIYVVDAVGAGGIREISHAELEGIRNIGRVTFSPDGSRIAFRSTDRGRLQHLGIHVVDLEEATIERPVDADSPIYVNGDPEFTPDGRSLVFSGMGEDGNGIYATDISSGGWTKIADGETGQVAVADG